MERFSRVDNLTDDVMLSFWQVYQLAVDIMMLCNKHQKTSVAYSDKHLLLTYFRSAGSWLAIPLILAKLNHMCGGNGVSTDFGWGSPGCGLAGCPLVMAGAIRLCSTFLSSSFWD